MSYGVGLRNGVAFALGTIPSLTSGGGLRPSLLLNFLSGTLDPRITFSRGTQATQYTSNGTLQYAPNNLLTYSNAPDNAAWTKSNSFVQTNLLTYSNTFSDVSWPVSLGTKNVAASALLSPEGIANAWTLTDSSAVAFDGIQKTATVAADGATYTGSVYILKTSGGTSSTFGINFQITGGTAVGNQPRINTDTGAVLGGTATVTNAGSWWRVSFSVTNNSSVGNTNLTISLYPATAAYNSGVDIVAATGSATIYGAQLVQGSVPGNYVATTSAALPVLYADYNGVVRARKLCETTANATHVGFQILAKTAGVATYTISLNFKVAEPNRWMRLLLSDSATANYSAVFFDPTTGTVASSVVNVGFTGGAASIASLGNGWYRAILSATTDAVSTGIGFQIYLANSASTTTYTGDGSSGIYIADAQLEAGSTAQAYNDTTSAAYYGPRFDYDPTNLVRQNLLLYSQAFDDAAWGGFDVSHIVSANSAIAPDGTLTADAWTWPASTTNFGFNAQTITGNASQAYTYSVWVRLQTGAKNIRLKISNVTVATLTSANINLTTTWQRISYSIPANALAQTTQVGVAFELGSSSSVGAGDIIELWGAQLNIGSTALTYTATTTAPYTLCAARGLLIEEQRANLLLQSNDFQTSWNPTNITRTLNATLSPDGNINGVKIEATAAAATALYEQVTSTATSHTFSVYVKQGTGAAVANTFGFRNITTLTNLVFVTLNFSTGAIAYSVGSTGASAANIGNGWWRVVISVTAGITVGDLVAGYVGWSGAVATAGDFLYAYGAQLEAGAFATSYIPTVGSQVTRSADSATIAASTWYNTAAGTWYFTGETQAFPRYLIVDNSGVTKYPMYVHSAAGGIGNFDGTNLTLTVNTTVAGTTFKAATVYGTTVAKAVLNGGTVATGTYNGAFSTIATFLFGASTGGAQICGHIQLINYYPISLPDASIKGLTV